jgi:hypothetical protein
VSRAQGLPNARRTPEQNMPARTTSNPDGTENEPNNLGGKGHTSAEM